MLNSLALIFLIGLALSALCKKIHIPGLVGMLFTGILLGPYGLDLLDNLILFASSELRAIALIIILLRAGLSLDIEDLREIGRPALLMSIIPATAEIIAYLIFAPKILGLSLIDSALLGSVISAISPAVVVPRMISLIENRYGREKSVPQLIMAGASCDDVYVIVLFTTFLSMAKGDGTSLNLLGLSKVPISITSGIIFGLVAGYALFHFFEMNYVKKKHIRNSVKVIVILSISFLFMTVEDLTSGYLSGLLAIMSLAIMLRYKSIEHVSVRLSIKLGKLWIAAEVMLFVLVGAAVDIRYTLSAGIPALVLIFIALVFRSVGVLVSLIGTNLNRKERLFCVIAYIPKATVQAAIGGMALSAGLPSGKIILSVAVLSIIITAPLGAFAIDFNYKKLLDIG